MLCESQIGRILEFHMDADDPACFVVGRLAGMDAQWFLVQDLTPVGRWNGLALYRKQDLVSVEEGTAYIRKLELLAQCRNEVPPAIPPISADLLRSLLGYAKEKEAVIGLELYSKDYSSIEGVLEELHLEMLCIRQIDEFGRDDGVSYLALDVITRCFVGDEDGTCLELLRKANAEGALWSLNREK